MISYELPDDDMEKSAARHVLELDLRADFFDEKLFNDPCWNIVSACFAFEAAGKRFTLTDALKHARVSPHTGRRWLDVLSSGGWLLLENEAMPDSPVRLTALARQAMTTYLGKLESRLGHRP